MIKLSMMVTLYNPDKENINNINKYLKYIDKIYLVDNSSIDNSNLFNHKKIKYIPLMENKGIATALNVAAREAIKDKYRWLITMDQDSFLSEDNYNKLSEYLNKNIKNLDKVGIISPRHTVKNIELKTNGEDVEEMLDVMTSGNLLNLDLFKKIGGFLDWLFIDCVDTEYCLRLNKLGYKVLRLNYVNMKHNLGNQEVHYFFKKRMVCSNHNYVRRYYQVRNNYYIIDLYKDVYPERCEQFKRDQKGQLRRVILFEKDKIRKLRYMYKGYKDYKKGIKGKLND